MTWAIRTATGSIKRLSASEANIPSPTNFLPACSTCGSSGNPGTTPIRPAFGRPFDSGRVSFLHGGVRRELTVSPSNLIGIPTGSATNIYQAHTLAELSSKWNLNVYAGVNDIPDDW